MRLNGKVAIVTGGAAGIGEATVRAFLREGASTAFVDINEKKGQALAKELSDAGGCAFFPGNITNEETCAWAVEETEKRFGPVTILVNNAARFVFKSIEATAEDWRNSLDVNVIAASLITKHAVRSMKRAGGGAIVNMGSISAFIAQSGTLTYNATKAALVEMTRCMALDLASCGIRVNCVCPGYILTSALYGFAAESGWNPADLERELASKIILKRLGKPEEIANCIAFLCSDEASYVTGAFLMADGGLTAI